MSYSNITQNPAYQPGIEPLDSWFAAIENLTAEGDANSINIPWLLSLSTTQGNAYTKAISQNAVVWIDPEWGEVTGGGKGSMYGNGGQGSGEGGLYVSF